MWSHFPLYSKILWVKSSHFVLLICHVDHKKAAWFESDFCVSCASCIAELLAMDLLACKILLNVTDWYGCLGVSMFKSVVRNLTGHIF